jgi:DNA adenine methylase
MTGRNDQQGNYKANCRFNKSELVLRTKRITEQRDKIVLYNLDASVPLRTKSEIMNKMEFLLS